MSGWWSGIPRVQAVGMTPTVHHLLTRTRRCPPLIPVVCLVANVALDLPHLTPSLSPLPRPSSWSSLSRWLPIVRCRSVRLSVWWPYARLTSFGQLASISARAERPGCLLAFRKLLAPPGRAAARVAGGVSGAASPSRPAGVRSNFRHAVPKRGHLGDCSDSMARSTQRGTVGRNGESHAITGSPLNRGIGARFVHRGSTGSTHHGAGICSRFSCCVRTLSPTFLPTFPHSRAAQRRALNS